MKARIIPGQLYKLEKELFGNKKEILEKILINKRFKNNLDAAIEYVDKMELITIDEIYKDMLRSDEEDNERCDHVNKNCNINDCKDCEFRYGNTKDKKELSIEDAKNLIVEMIANGLIIEHKGEYYLLPIRK